MFTAALKGTYITSFGGTVYTISYDASVLELYDTAAQPMKRIIVPQC